MKKKEPFAAKLLKYFYGVEELDEYREQELNRINSQTFVLVWIYVVMSNVVFVFILLKNPQLAAWTMLISNVLVFGIIIPIYTLILAKKLDLLATEVAADDFRIKRKKALRRSIWSAVGWTAYMIVYYPLITWWENGGSLLDYLADIFLSPRIVLFPLSGVLFGYLIWQIAKSNIRREETPKKSKKTILLTILKIGIVALCMVLLGYISRLLLN